MLCSAAIFGYLEFLGFVELWGFVEVARGLKIFIFDGILWVWGIWGLDGVSVGIELILGTTVLYCFGELQLELLLPVSALGCVSILCRFCGYILIL